MLAAPMCFQLEKSVGYWIELIRACRDRKMFSGGCRLRIGRDNPAWIIACRLCFCMHVDISVQACM